jgi:hypothetical protein
MKSLPMSTEPSKIFQCSSCPNGEMSRRIINPGAIKGFKVFAGDWFKKEYGHDIGQAYEDKARQAEDRKTLEREFRKNQGL